ncbi:PPC domain-containing DNA-binding protein [uncultured Clostridium sp.]|uniref:PPC domain-containing DNA-binding protein n=1 Tax=uncultured Clostridium sp. TaxID=59620 RepID=UPI0028E6D38F|nr:PPC domain-containing DNA-binding protein [uncultured Clostridium sp.]
MDYRKFGQKYIIRLDKGDEIIASIKEICKKEKIKLASVTGIGATNKVTIGIFELDKKVYNQKEFCEDFEITSLVGNVIMSGDELIPHIHINLGDKELNVKGGHLNSAIISVTGEIILDVIDGEVSKELNEDIGIKLMKF